MAPFPGRVRVVGVLVLALPVAVLVASTHARPLFLSTLGCRLELRCQDAAMRTVLEHVYGALCVDVAPSRLGFAIERDRGVLLFRSEGERVRAAANEDELLGLLDEAIVVHLQRRRPDLFFVHSAVLELGGRAILLVAPSGTGKSTTTWALSHHGFRYLSDELAPIDLGTLRVHPFPRALHLKAAPPAEYPLPPAVRQTPGSLHVVPKNLPGGVCRDSLRLGAIVFLHRESGITPSIRHVSAAEATATLLANALNPLAHGGDGLDPAMAVARSAPCFSVGAGDLEWTSRLVRNTVEGLSLPSA